VSDKSFDREWRLDELLEPAALARLGPVLVGLLGDVAVLDAGGRLLWGELAGEARREPLVLELEALGYLASAGAAPHLL